MKIKEYLNLILGWILIQFTILAVCMLCWNLVMPGLGIHKINFLQIILIYVFFKCLTFDWVAYYNTNVPPKN